MASRSGTPLETRDVGLVVQPSEVIGRTDKPSSSIRKGNSLVPWAEPRYLTTRSRRVETCSLTRWSRGSRNRRRTLRVRAESGVLAALGRDDRGDALLLEPAEETAEFGPQDGRVRQAAEEHLQGVEHDPLGPIESIA